MTLILVHGFGYDPAHLGGKGDPEPFFEELRDITGRDDAIGYPWFSVPRSLKGFAYTWLTWPPYLHRYRKAWALTNREAVILAAVIQSYVENGNEVELIGHSLGTRLIRLALGMIDPHAVKRVLFLNGAELQAEAVGTAWRTRAQILNVAVRTDDVLHLMGERFAPGRGKCIGRDGFGPTIKPANWRDLFTSSRSSAEVPYLASEAGACG